MWKWWLRALRASHTKPLSPCSGCCYRSAVSGGSCSACSSASSPCGNRRSWGPSGCRGNGPAEACSETSSQMDWRVGRPGNRVKHHHHLTRTTTNKTLKSQTDDGRGPKETGHTSKHKHKQDEIITIKTTTTWDAPILSARQLWLVWMWSTGISCSPDASGQ